jgi:hypothetical protein
MLPKFCFFLPTRYGFARDCDKSSQVVQMTRAELLRRQLEDAARLSPEE